VERRRRHTPRPQVLRTWREVGPSYQIFLNRTDEMARNRFNRVQREPPSVIAQRFPRSNKYWLDEWHPPQKPKFRNRKGSSFLKGKWAS
jgi:hypothetical protein